MKRRKDVNKLKLKHQTADGTESKLSGTQIRFCKCDCGLEGVCTESLPLYLFVLVLCIRIYYVLQPRNWWLLHPDEVFQSVEDFLIDNIFVMFGGHAFQQTVGISMGTNCASLLADQFLYSYEPELLEGLLKRKEKTLAQTCNFKFNYSNDVLSFEIKDTTNTLRGAFYLDLLLEIDSGKLQTRFYDKRNNFKFPIVKLPFIDSNIPAASAYVAYSEVYGHGFRTYEYSPPIVNITTPVEEQEVAQGMYSLRSFMYPQFFVAVFTICKYLGITYNGYLIGRITHSIVTSFTTVTVYRLCKTMFKCRGIALLSSITTSFSLHLSVLGTHTLINSFISPFLFLALDFIVKHIINHDNKARRCKTELPSQTPGTLNGYERSQSHNLEDNKRSLHGDLYDINSNHKVETNVMHAKKETVATSNTHSSDLVIQKHTSDRGKDSSVNWNGAILAISGMMTAIICYIRPDTFIFVGFFGLSFLSAFHHSISVRKLLYLTASVGCGFASGIIAGGAVDFYFYGTWFISPLQWSRLNGISQVPAILYGAQSPHQYVLDIFASRSTDFCLNGFFVVALISKLKQSQNTDHEDRKVIASLIVTSLAVLLVFSTIGHKELRFVYNVLVVVNCLSAYAIHGVLQSVQRKLNLSQVHLRIFLFSFSFIAAANSYINFPEYQKNIILPWNTVTPSDSSDLNHCLHFIGQRNDVTGVFLDGSIYMTAGYSILRHDVPLITLIHHEYHEYRPGEYKPRTDLMYNAPKNLRVINRYSDIIDVFNIHYLTKRLLESNEYNYIVISKARLKSFEPLGFNNALFSAGRFFVVLRSTSSENKFMLSEMGAKMTIGQNATLLEYEASWLYTAGQYKKVIPRLVRAIELSEERIRPFQLLAASFINLKMYDKAEAIEDKCFAKHGSIPCRQPQPRIVIHEEYNAYSVR